MNWNLLVTPADLVFWRIVKNACSVRPWARDVHRQCIDNRGEEPVWCGFRAGDSKKLIAIGKDMKRRIAKDRAEMFYQPREIWMMVVPRKSVFELNLGDDLGKPLSQRFHVAQKGLV